MDDQLPEFQPGDIIEIEIPIRHSANLAAARAEFVLNTHQRDVNHRFDEEATLSATTEPGLSLAEFTLLVEKNHTYGQYKMKTLRVDTKGGRKNILVEDSPVIGFKILPEDDNYLRAEGYEMRKL